MASFRNQPLPSYPQPPPYPCDEQSYRQRPSAPYPIQDSSHSQQPQPIPRPYNQPRHNSLPPPPGMVQWLQETNYESPIIGIPQGLEYLAQINRIIVQQKVDYVEMHTGWENQHQYIISNQNGQPIFHAIEESNACARQFLGKERGYTLHILDNFRREVMTIRRPFKCCGTLCCSHETTIEAPPGSAIGYIQQKFGLCKKKFILHSVHHEPQLKIKGPNECSLNFCCLCTDKKFEVRTLRKDRIGEICKQFTELGVELFTEADTFTVNFPMELDVFAKASLIGATFLIDFLCFEKK